MSTKRTLKRIALVAVSTLGFGLLSIAPSKAAVNDALFAFVNKSSTVNVNSLGAVALATMTSSTAPGVSYTANGAITDSVATLTVPASTVIAFRLTGTPTAPATAWSAGTTVRIATGGSTLGAYACATIATVTCTLANFTAPATAGTYPLTLTISGASNSFAPADVETISITLIVTSAVNQFLDFGNSAATSALHVSGVGITKVNTSGRVANAVSFTPNFTVKNGTGAGSNSNLRAARLVYSLTLPSGSAGSIVTAAVAGTASTSQTVQGADEALNAGASNTASNPGTIMYFIPATAGTYTVTLFHDANRDGLLSAGEAQNTASWVVAADALPSITFTKYGTNTTAALATQANDGQLVKVSLRNGTNAWNLAGNEVLRITAASTTGVINRSTSFNSAGAASWNEIAGLATIDLSASNFNGNGDAWINVADTSTLGGTFSYSATIVGGTAAGASGSFTITTSAANDATITTDYLAFAPVTGAASTAAGYLTNVNVGAGTADDGTFGATGADTVDIKPGATTSVSVGVQYGATNYQYVSAIVYDTYGLWTGVTGAKYAIAGLGLTTGAVATSTASVSVSVPGTSTALVASGTTIGTIDMLNAAANAVVHSTTIRVATAAQDSVAVNPSTLGTTYSLRAAVGATNTFTATVFDQYGNAMNGVGITARVTAGRNAQDLATAGVTDANGQFSFTVVDSSTASLSLLSTDTVAFISGGKTGTVTINYATYNAVSKVAITGAATADVAPTRTTNAINTGTSGASATRVTMTATLTDVNGATLPAGVPVTWSISGLSGTSAIWVDPTTGYDWSTSRTNANGQAVTYIYAWATGTVTVSATAGGVTAATGKINFVNAAADARVVSATVKDNIITAKVVDRYGNAVEGVSLTATRNSGVGYFSGSASSSAVGTTNSSGTVDFVLTGGAANVSVATTTLNFGQTSSAAAAVNGTAITATSIGASLSPAGVQSVTVDVKSDTPSNIASKAAADAATDAANAAADAAAEAIDAANAATDAANLAAEAADAATVAAEEARDAADAATAAVEELATQVATLMAALKAQITTLANTVAKIAKKVKA